MIVKELISELKKLDSDAVVNLEMKVDGVEFTTELEGVYTSGEPYLYADFRKPTKYRVVEE